MRPYDEAKAQRSGKSGGSFYAEDLVLATEQRRLRDAPHIIRAEDQVWEDCPHGRLRHIAHPKLNPHVYDIDAYIQELAPDGRSGKHRHMAEEFIFFLEGRGYSLHWDVDLAEMGDTFHWRRRRRPEALRVGGDATGCTSRSTRSTSTSTSTATSRRGSSARPLGSTSSWAVTTSNRSSRRPPGTA